MINEEKDNGYKGNEVPGIDIPDRSTIQKHSGVRINCGLNLEHSPAGRLILQYLTAVSNKDAETLKGILSSKIVWNSIGRETTEGVDEFIRALMISNQEITEVRVESIITHGREGASRTDVFKKDGLMINLGEFFRFGRSGNTMMLTAIDTFVIEEHVLPD